MTAMIDTCFMIYDILYFMYMMIYLYDDFRWYDPASKFHRRQEHRFDGARMGFWATTIQLVLS